MNSTHNSQFTTSQRNLKYQFSIINFEVFGILARWNFFVICDVVSCEFNNQRLPRRLPFVKIYEHPGAPLAGTSHALPGGAKNRLREAQSPFRSHCTSAGETKVRHFETRCALRLNEPV